MSFFVTMVDDSYQFTTAGYVAMILILIAVFVGAAALAQKGVVFYATCQMAYL